MNLGDGFTRRKEIDAAIQTWTNRLKLAGHQTKHYETLVIEGANKFQPIPGSIKTYERTYTIEECREKLEELIAEDRELALRISKTNKMAKATVIDLDGKEKEWTIPELLVLRNEIAPKLEESLRATPFRATGVEILATDPKSTLWRSITPQYKREQSMGEKGNVIENQIIEKYIVEEVTDFGRSERDIYDQIDAIHQWMVRLKVAINDANKTELLPL